jgi:hypothetical protein
MCVLCRYGVLFPQRLKICIGLAGILRQQLATVTYVANDMVWLTGCCFTASWQGGGGGGGGVRVGQSLRITLRYLA